MNERPELCPSVSPIVEPIEAPLINEEVTLGVGLESLSDMNGEDVVEAAELLLREGAPHDFDVIIIGAGPGGLSCATHLAQQGQSVALIERDDLGGSYLNRGCIPTKTLLESASMLRQVRRSAVLRIDIEGQVHPDLRRMQARKRMIISNMRSRNQQQLEESGVQVIYGEASLEGDRTIHVTESSGTNRRLTAIHLVIATGGRPTKHTVEGTDLTGVFTSDDILEIEEVPRTLTIIGAGRIGVEFACLFAELGTRVCLVEEAEAILPGEDKDIQLELKRLLELSNIQITLGVSIRCIQQDGNLLDVSCFKTSDRTEANFQSELVLMATGRTANIENLGLEKAGVETYKGHIKTDDSNSTSATGVWAIGDCIHSNGWGQQAILEGRRVAEAILGVENESQIPLISRCYHTFPQVASIGMTLEEALDRGLNARATRYPFRHNESANMLGSDEGFVKLVSEVGTNRLLGSHIIGPQAAELINGATVILAEGGKLEKLAGALSSHPTLSQALAEAAKAALREI